MPSSEILSLGLETENGKRKAESTELSAQRESASEWQKVYKFLNSPQWQSISERQKGERSRSRKGTRGHNRGMILSYMMAGAASFS